MSTPSSPVSCHRNRVGRRCWLAGAGVLVCLLLAGQTAAPAAMARPARAAMPETPEGWRLAFGTADIDELWPMVARQIRHTAPPVRSAGGRRLRHQALVFAHGKLEALVMLRGNGSGGCTPRQVFEFNRVQLIATLPRHGPLLRLAAAFGLTVGNGQSPETLNRLDAIAEEAARLGQGAFPWAWAVPT